MTWVSGGGHQKSGCQPPPWGLSFGHASLRAVVCNVYLIHRETHVRVKSRPHTVAVLPRDTMVIMSLASRRTVRVSLLRAGTGEQQGGRVGTCCWY